MYAYSMYMFPCALSGTIFSCNILFLYFLCRKSWRTAATRWSLWRSNDHKYRQHTHKQRSNGEGGDPPARARPTERICLSATNEMWHLAGKRCGQTNGNGLATLRATNTMMCTYVRTVHIRSVAQPPLIQLLVANAVVTQLLNGQERRVEWTTGHMAWLDLALIRFGRRLGEGECWGRARRIGSQTSGFISFSRKHTANNPTKPG